MQTFCIWFSLFLVLGRVWIGLNFDPAMPTLVDVFKDASHVFIGVLIVPSWKAPGLYRDLFWWLCVIEVIVSVVSRI